MQTLELKRMFCMLYHLTSNSSTSDNCRRQCYLLMSEFLNKQILQRIKNNTYMNLNSLHMTTNVSPDVRDFKWQRILPHDIVTNIVRQKVYGKLSLRNFLIPLKLVLFFLMKNIVVLY